jgi:hypothetical protein
VSWFAAAVSNAPSYVDTIRLFRWDGRRWSSAGSVSAAGTPGGLGSVTAAHLTGSSSPDFTFSDDNGADWVAFMVLADLGGRWRAVPFDSGPGLTTVMDSHTTRGGLVKGENNACGCAAGPETYIWYRFNGKIFTPTTPPGTAPRCTPAAVDAATPLLGGYLGLDPWTQAELAAKFVTGRVECAEGWALATGRRNGTSVTALLEQSGSHWLRAAVGSIGELNSHVDNFALPFSVLERLEARLGLRHVPPLTWPGGGGPSSTPGRHSSPTPSTTPAAVPIAPGSQFVDSTVVKARGARWFAAVNISAGSNNNTPLSIYIYQWEHASWALRAEVDDQRQSRVTQADSYQVVGVTTQSARPPEFVIKSVSVFSNRSLLTIADTGGRWHVTG